MDISIRQLRNSNEQMFKSIVESYWPRLHKFAQIYVLDREVAKEIVQDTLFCGNNGKNWTKRPV